MIYDCFPFFSELELLNVRLHELYEHVDYFVLVEATETFRGDTKPLYYEQNKNMFTQFADKIIHVVVGEFFANNPWNRERYQKNQVLQGLENCAEDDIILISDCDEILKPSVFVEIKEKMKKLEKERFPMVLCEQTNYFYYLNRLDVTRSWPGPVAVYYKDAKLLGTDQCREIRCSTSHRIKNAGWHFSYMGGHERVVKKLASFSHFEADIPRNRNSQLIREKKINALKIVPIDDSYPKLIREYPEQWEKAGFLDDSASMADEILQSDSPPLLTRTYGELPPYVDVK